MNSEKMLEALLKVRDSNQCNMLDTRGIYRAMPFCGCSEQALVWKELTPGQQMDLLDEMGDLAEARDEAS